MNEPQDNWCMDKTQQYAERKKATHTQIHKKKTGLRPPRLPPRISKISNTM